MADSLHTTDCPICLETKLNKNVTKTRCGHTFCFPCLYHSVHYARACPMCQAVIVPSAINEDYTLYCSMIRLYGEDYKSHPNWKIAKHDADKQLLRMLAFNTDMYANGTLSNDDYNRMVKRLIIASLRLDTHMIRLAR